jgi:hypothetical protein
VYIARAPRCALQHQSDRDACARLGLLLGERCARPRRRLDDLRARHVGPAQHAALTATRPPVPGVECASSTPGPMPRVMRPTVRLAPPGSPGDDGAPPPEDDRARVHRRAPPGGLPADLHALDRRGTSGIVQAGPAELAAPLAVLALGPLTVILAGPAPCLCRAPS